MADDELYFATATELARLLRAKEVSSVELTRLFLARLENLGLQYNALAELTPDLALAQARRADRAIHSGKALSALHGVPYGAKDLLATRNIPTRWGAPPFREQVFDYDATVIRRLRDAGAVLLGKLAMVELAGGGGYAYASASLHGPGLNPWNVRHWAGGSSSGSASAVAAGLVPYALGSETRGSIMSPSAYCGITGLRPTWGLVSRYGAMELGWSMDKIGPMAHSAEDCGWVLQTLAGYDAKDSTTSVRDFRFSARIDRREFRLGVLPADFGDEPEIEEAFEEALRTLRRAGLKIAPIDLPDLPYAETTRTILNGETAAAFQDLIKSKRLDELVDTAQKEGLRRNLQLTAVELLDAQRKRGPLTRQVLQLFDRVDALVSPTAVNVAPALDTNLQTMVRKRGNYSMLGALCGVPAVSLPMGFGRQGLPLGLCLTGNLWSENTILQIGMIYQRETDWHRRIPVLKDIQGHNNPAK